LGFYDWLKEVRRADRAFFIAQVVAKHRAWFPVHNRGREAPLEALADWERQLRPLPKNELILLITDNRARNRVLGKKWPPAAAKKYGG
jgi:hypothetical protein